MSLAAITVQELPEFNVGALAGATVRDDPSTAPEPIEVLVETEIILVDPVPTVDFRIPNPPPGIDISASGAVITNRQPNADLRLRLALTTDGYTFYDHAILWITPPQQGFESNPFGRLPIRAEPGNTMAVLPNRTGPAGSRLMAQFALILNGRDGQCVVIDPTIIDDPNG